MTVVLNIGALDQRVTLQSPAEAEDSLGQAVRSGWTDVATVWARAEPLRSRELLAANGRLAEATVRFTIRHRSDVRANWRVLWRDQAHAVLGDPIDLQGAGQALELLCASGARAA